MAIAPKVAAIIRNILMADPFADALLITPGDYRT
jgi:hypothetical protein